ncbi:AMP-dependent synthetase/ligase [Marinivivus vitaminiproducens]|uniref:AMP-dependent synthetase/ligase n=1 Tax=Marinivivus vitaminiproducens TaxID=3035935 RepID=UPI00279AF9EB|nr:AMP-dependent synthetase/ligase [Geminicoccaceae bacterium SCSIO 64248]
MAAPRFEDNLIQLFRQQARKGGDAPFLWRKQEGAYRARSWQRAEEEVDALARALIEFGVAPGDRVALIAENRPEWAIADLAIMAAGGLTVPGYTTSMPDDHAYVLQHSGAKGVIVSGKTAAKRVAQAVASASDVRFILVIDGHEDTAGATTPVMCWKEALDLGGERKAVPLPGDAADPDRTACFIYTSGTGGRPKAVMQSHRNILTNVRAAQALMDRTCGVSDDEVFLSFLPLSHAYEHTCGQFLAIALGAQTYYAESVEALSRNLQEAKPTIMTCVPRLHEVLRQKLIQRIDREGGLKARLFHQAVRLGRKRYEQGGRLGVIDGLADAVLERLVRGKVREQFGGRIKALVSGGAPLNYDVGVFFVALGLPLLQGYGQTEASPLISVNPPGGIRIETVGPPVDFIEVRLAEDGEILVRGPSVMKGYWQDEGATAEVLKGEWLHTGDVGEIDGRGYLRITDRKKDLIVNSGGDNISPQRVEGVLSLEPEIAQAIVFGDRRPHLVALLVADDAAVKRAGVAKDGAELDAHEGLRTLIGEAVRRANAKLSGAEKVRRFHIMAEPFSVENKLMTPTLKLRRGVIAKAHADLVEGLYAKGA